MQENQCSYLRVLIIKQFQNTIWEPKLAHPAEKNLDSSTSPSETDALAKTPDKHSDSYSTPICPMKSPSTSLQGLRQPLWPSVNPTSHVSASRASASPTLAILKHCAVPGCLCQPLAGSASLSPGFCVDAPGTLSTSLLLYSLPLICNSDHSFNFLSKPCHRKLNSLINLVCYPMTLKPPLILLSLTIQWSRLSP